VLKAQGSNPSTAKKKKKKDVDSIHTSVQFLPMPVVITMKE
jgi:hypothetical protein